MKRHILLVYKRLVQDENADVRYKQAWIMKIIQKCAK